MPVFKTGAFNHSATLPTIDSGSVIQRRATASQARAGFCAGRIVLIPSSADKQQGLENPTFACIGDERGIRRHGDW
jgi:hypothetical protein